ncbi:hypothetical protein [Streptomyces sp. NPDC059949]|uniref:ATP-dependent DNA ligase n=1 Tax=Streptomyces sp. NPDC059949 TaxID=3347013 RepID=UPI00365F44ED
MLARPVTVLPAPGPRPVLFEQKADGFRVLVFTGPQPYLQSRRGADLRGAFPELVLAAAELGVEAVLDAELVVWGARGLDFPALQERARRRGATAHHAARERPAHLIVFDLLEMSGAVLLDEPLRRRRGCAGGPLCHAAVDGPVGTVPADFRPGDGRRLAGPGVGGGWHRGCGDQGSRLAIPARRAWVAEAAHSHDGGGDHRRGHRSRSRAVRSPARPVRPWGPPEADRPFHATVPARGGRAGQRPSSRRAGASLERPALLRRLGDLRASGLPAGGARPRRRDQRRHRRGHGHLSASGALPATA